MDQIAYCRGTHAVGYPSTFGGSYIRKVVKLASRLSLSQLLPPVSPVGNTGVSGKDGESPDAAIYVPAPHGGDGPGVLSSNVPGEVT